MIQQKRLQLYLCSPAFLGDAHQSGVWRTPPIKALLREWWRVAAAPESGYHCPSLRVTEGLLFGNAWLKDADEKSRFCKSKVRMALGHWDEGKIRTWEVQDPQVLYLGYGPLIFQKGKKIKANAALQ